MRFYLTAYGSSTLFATLPRSGYNYAMLIINVAWDISQGGKGDYGFDGRVWVPRFRLQRPFDWRIILDEQFKLPSTGIPFIFHTHTPYHKIVNLRTGKMRIVLLFRNLVNQLESYFFHQGYDVSTQDEFIRAGYIQRSIEFMNDWGAFLENYQDCLLIKYENLIANPYPVIKNIIEFLGLEIPSPCIQFAIEKCTKEEMRKQIPDKYVTSNKRISITRRKSPFSKKNSELIRNKIIRELTYDFGYDYSGSKPEMPTN